MTQFVLHCYVDEVVLKPPVLLKDLRCYPGVSTSTRGELCRSIPQLPLCSNSLVRMQYGIALLVMEILQCINEH